MSEETGGVLELVDALNAARAEVVAHAATVAAKDAEIRELEVFKAEASDLKVKLAEVEELSAEREKAGNLFGKQAAEHAEENRRFKNEVAMLTQQRDAFEVSAQEYRTAAEALEFQVERLEGEVRTLQVELDRVSPLATAAEALRAAFEATPSPVVEEPVVEEPVEETVAPDVEA